MNEKRNSPHTPGRGVPFFILKDRQATACKRKEWMDQGGK
jgi:hypothetical protein